VLNKDKAKDFSVVYFDSLARLTPARESFSP